MIFIFDSDLCGILKVYFIHSPGVCIQSLFSGFSLNFFFETFPSPNLLRNIPWSMDMIICANRFRTLFHINFLYLYIRATVSIFFISSVKQLSKLYFYLLRDDNSTYNVIYGVLKLNLMLAMDYTPTAYYIHKTGNIRSIWFMCWIRVSVSRIRLSHIVYVHNGEIIWKRP